jgi:hypothetical protein
MFDLESCPNSPYKKNLGKNALKKQWKVFWILLKRLQIRA